MWTKIIFLDNYLNTKGNLKLLVVFKYFNMKNLIIWLRNENKLVTPASS